MDEVVKELKCRARIMSIYNKTSDEFDTKEGWDDYLETIEDIIYNLTNNVDVQQTEARIHDYERANRANIISNQAKKAGKEREALGVLPSVAAASAAAAAAEAAAGPQSFAPPAMVNSAMGRQPVPVKPYTLSSSGSIVPPPGARRLAMGSQQERALSAPAGWSPDLPRLRAIQEAFGSLMLTSQ